MTMTKEQFDEKFEDIIRDDFVKKFMRERKEFLLKSGAVDLEAIPNNYAFVKDVVSVLFERLSFQYSTVGCSSTVVRESKKRIKNIKHFI